jgi:predicted phosphodiesterase
VRVVCLSDTHDQHGGITVPDGDLLVHAGDATLRGTRAQIEAFDAWLAGLPHPHKVLIAGNHDFAFERDPAAPSWIRSATYLEDQGVVVGGLRIWGSPWQPRFFDWAFNLDRGAPLAAVWAKIPGDTDVLITHGPPRGILDCTSRGEAVGCDDLLREVLERVRPRLHVFGHIHEAHGREERDGITFVNASICDLRHSPVHPPIVVDL